MYSRRYEYVSTFLSSLAEHIVNSDLYISHQWVHASIISMVRLYVYEYVSYTLSSLADHIVNSDLYVSHQWVHASIIFMIGLNVYE